MLLFSTASEPGEMLAETLQWKVSQCVAVEFSSFAPVQMPKFLCIFGIAMLAAYTVAPRQSSLGCLPQSVWRYMCALRPTHLQNPLQLQACLHCTGFLQTSLQRIGIRVYSAAQCLPHILWRLGRAVSVACPHPIWRYTVALRHPQMPQASAAANLFAAHRLPTSVASLVISPDCVMQIFCSTLGFCVYLHIKNVM